MRTYASRDGMDERYFQTVRQMMESQAYRELAAARLFGHGLQFVSDLRWIEYVAENVHEEVEHLEAVVEIYERLVGEALIPKVLARLAERPVQFAGSWFELAMAQFLFDRGGFWQLREYEDCSFLPYREIVGKIIGEETDHQGMGERLVVELCRSGEYEAVKQRFFETWLREGLLSFGRPGTEGNRYAISVGIKRRDSGEVMQDYVNDIKPVVKACGLTFPTPEALGLEVPDWLDWSLDGVKPADADRWTPTPRAERG